jgi:hypothetical protein
VVVDDLDLEGVTAAPDEADPPLAIDSDAVLPRPIPFQLLEPIGRRDPQVFDPLGSVEHSQLPETDPLNVRPEAFHALALEEALGVSVREALDHFAS